MRKTLSKILIALLMIGVFLAPTAKTLNAQGTQQPTNLGQSVVNFTATDVAGNDMTTSTGAGAADASASAQASIDEYGCSITSWGGCIAKLIFELVWTPISWILTKAADVLDFFIAYSISSSAYTNGFIDKAWAAVRDIANIFFIIALLYIALKTILDSNISSQKRLIANVIIFALLINFSLFVTKVVIDTSNILTKVFYAQITPMDGNGVPIPADSEKPKSVSLGLMKNVMNPKVMVPVIKGNLAAFFIVTIITIGMMIYIIIMFMSVAILFVSRVAGLWIAMIFAPLAFMSYALPFDIPGFGHRKWWDLLLKNAFLAPIFVFFLYIVILFGGFLKDFPYNNPDSDWGNQIMGAIIPLMLVFILLKKAKDLAVEYAGELGQGMTSSAKVLGGIGLAATGAGLAFAGTRFAGGYASKLLAGNAETWKEQAKQKGLAGWSARMKLAATTKATKGTFDFRKTVAADLVNKQAGLDMQSPAGLSFLSSKQGGLKGAQERKAEKIKEQMEMVTGTGMNDEQVRAWSKKNQETWDEKQKYSGMSVADYEKKFGKRPEYYESAQALKKERLEAFKDNMTTSTLTGSLAYELVKKLDGFVNKDNYENSSAYWRNHYEKSNQKARELLGKNFKPEEFEANYKAKKDGYYINEYDADIAKKINDVRINATKMGIGALATVATGGVFGAMVVPAAVGYGVQQKAEQYGVEGGAQSIVAKSIDKEIKDSENKGARINATKNLLTNYSKSVENSVSYMDRKLKNKIDEKILSEKSDGKKFTPEEEVARRKELEEEYTYIKVSRNEETGKVKKDSNENIILESVDKDKLAKATIENTREVGDLRDELKGLKESLRFPGGKPTIELENKMRDLLAQKRIRNLTTEEEKEIESLNTQINQIKSSGATMSADELKAIQDKIKAKEEELDEATLHGARLNELKTIPENIARAARDLSNLTGEKVAGGGDDKK